MEFSMGSGGLRIRTEIARCYVWVFDIASVHFGCTIVTFGGLSGIMASLQDHPWKTREWSSKGTCKCHWPKCWVFFF